MSSLNQREIAAQVGLSQSSVSRALKGDCRISRSTREKVLRAAKALGYEPDPAVSVLAGYRWNRNVQAKGLSLALLTNRPKNERLLSGYNELVMEARNAGYSIDVIELADVPSSRALLRILKARGVAGVFCYLNDRVALPPLIAEVCERYAAVNWNCVIEHPICPGVYRDSYHRVADCCEAIRQRGYQRALIVLPGNPKQPTDCLKKMHAAWLLHQRQCPGWDNAYIADYSEANWDALAAKVRSSQPEAIIVANEDILAELRKRGIEPGRDFAFACMNVEAMRCYSGIASIFPLVARHSIELLSGMIARRVVGKDSSCAQVEIRGAWVDGDSL